MLSLDEQVEQIMRNAVTIGIDLPALIESGLVRVEYEPPQEIEVDVHFHHIEELVKEFKPKRVLIDSLSTYARQFVKVLARPLHDRLGLDHQAALDVALLPDSVEGTALMRMGEPRPRAPPPTT